MHHIFISYCRKDRHIAEVIEDELDQHGFNCWRDLSAVPGGARWEEYIADALASTRVVVLLASENAAESEWVRTEIEVAQQLQRPIIPIKFHETVPVWFARNLGHLNFVTFPAQTSTPTAMRQLLAGLKQAGLGVLDGADDTGLAWGHLQECFGEFPVVDQDRLKSIGDLTRRHFQATPGRPVWSVHGLRHANGLLYALGDLLKGGQPPDRQQAFCLVAAACLHDVSLVAPEYEDRDSAELRHAHAELSADWLARAPGLPSLHPREADTIESLVRFHNTSRNLRELADTPNIAALAAAFRVANACDAGSRRGPFELWRRYHDEIEDDAQVHFWLVNAMIDNVLVEPETRTIRVHGRAPTEDLLFIPRQLASEIGRRCQTARPFLDGWTVEFQGKVDPGLGGRIPILREQMVVASLGFMSRRLRFLSGPLAHLESSSSLVDNVIAAARAIVDAEYRSSVEAKLACLTDLVDQLLEARGELHLLHALRAQVEAAQRRPGTHEERLAQVATVIADFEKRRSVDGIVRSADAKLPQAPTDRPLRVFVFGKSGPVTAFLDSQAARGARVQVLTPLMRPVGEGAALQVPSALNTTHANLEVLVVPDAAIGHVLAGPARVEGPHASPSPSASEVPGPRSPTGGCDLVLMGCEAVFADEGREVADIGTSLGARPIAELAHAAGVPVWVLADTAKFVAYPSRSPWYTVTRPVQSVDAEDFIHEEDAVRWTRGKGQSYPRSEVVPGELVQYVVTDEGALTPKQAAQHVRDRLQPEG